MYNSFSIFAENAKSEWDPLFNVGFCYSDSNYYNTAVSKRDVGFIAGKYISDTLLNTVLRQSSFIGYILINTIENVLTDNCGWSPTELDSVFTNCSSNINKDNIEDNSYYKILNGTNDKKGFINYLNQINQIIEPSDKNPLIKIDYANTVKDYDTSFSSNEDNTFVKKFYDYNYNYTTELIEPIFTEISAKTCYSAKNYDKTKDSDGNYIYEIAKKFNEIEERLSNLENI